MKGFKVLWPVVLIVAAFIAQPAFGSYASIQHNLIDGTPDTAYNSATGEFSINASGSDLLTLNDPDPLGGTVTDAAVSLVSYFDGINISTGRAVFHGGSFLLSFKYNGTPYAIGGPVSGIEVALTYADDTLSILSGQGLFQATTKNLPGSGTWSDGGGLSSIDSLTLQIGQNLSDYDWSTPLTGGDTQYTLTPDDTAVPEPTSLLLVIAGLFFCRRPR